MLQSDYHEKLIEGAAQPCTLIPPDNPRIYRSFGRGSHPSLTGLTDRGPAPAAGYWTRGNITRPIWWGRGGVRR